MWNIQLIAGIIAKLNSIPTLTYHCVYQINKDFDSIGTSQQKVDS